MLKPELGVSTQEMQECASRTRLNSFQRAIFGRAVSALQAIQADSLKESEPEGRAARPVVNQGSDEPRERIQVHALSEGKLLGLGGNGSDGLHDRPPLSAQSKGDFRPRKL